MRPSGRSCRQLRAIRKGYEVSLDCKNWTKVVNEKYKSSVNIKEDYIVPTMGRYTRFSPSLSGTMRVWDFEAYGIPAFACNVVGGDNIEIGDITEDMQAHKFVIPVTGGELMGESDFLITVTNGAAYKEAEVKVYIDNGERPNILK